MSFVGDEPEPDFASLIPHARRLQKKGRDRIRTDVVQTENNAKTAHFILAETETKDINENVSHALIIVAPP